jgi:thioesterase domain-containing protein
MNPGGSKPPFFFVPDVSGQLLGYRDLAKGLGPDQPVYGLQAKEGTALGEQLTVELMAGKYIRSMKMVQPMGPYLLGGHSFGGFVAFEMARQLSVQGDRVALLALIDSRASGLPTYASLLPAPMWIRYTTGSLVTRLRFHLGSIRGLSWSARLGYFSSRLVRKLRGLRGAGKLDLGQDQPLPVPLQEIVDANLRALARYRPRPYPGKVTLFRAQERHPAVYDRQLLGWGYLAQGGIDIYEIPGDHVTIVKPPGLDVLVDRLKTALLSVTGGQAHGNA